MNRLRKDQKGFTIIECVIALGILMGCLAFGGALYANSTQDVPLAKAEVNIRAFQLGVSMYYNYFHKVPTERELYSTILQGQPDLGFTVIPAVDFYDKGYMDSNMPLFTTGDWYPNQYAQFEMPIDWIIISKGNNVDKVAYLYAIDDNAPVVVDYGDRPFSLAKVLEKRPAYLDRLTY